MITKRRQNTCKHLENPDDENAHDNPLAYLLRQGVFHDPPEAKTQHGDDRRHHDGRPNREAFAEGSFVNHNSVN